MRRRKKNWRNTSEYRKWKKAVLKKDNIECQVCGSKKRLVAHHIYDASHYPEKRLDIDNGVTLCNECHKRYHNDYLRSYRAKSDKDRWENFLSLAEYFKKVLNKSL